MTYAAQEGSDTTMAAAAHLSAITGPLVPWLIYRWRRNEDAFAGREAAKATNFGALVLAAFALATVVRIFVPLVSFLGTLAQLAIIVVAVALCVMAYRGARRGTPADYPTSWEIIAL